MPDDPRHAGIGLDIVDQRWFAVQASLRGVRRAISRHPALALDGLQQGGLLAANKRAAALHDPYVQIEPAVHDVLAQVPALYHTADCFLDVLHRQRVFQADVEHARMRAHSKRGDNDSLEDSVRVAFEQHPVHESARVAFVAVHNDELPGAASTADHPPFSAGREACTTTPAQAGRSYRVNDALGIIVIEDLPERDKALVPDILVNVGRIDVPAVLASYVLLAPKKLAHLLVSHIDGIPRYGLPYFVREQVGHGR